MSYGIPPEWPSTDYFDDEDDEPETSSESRAAVEHARQLLEDSLTPEQREQVRAARRV